MGGTNTQSHMVDWDNFETAINKSPAVYQTNIIKMVHNWANDGHQKKQFKCPEDPIEHKCSTGCDQIEAHQHYLSCFAPPMIKEKNKSINDLKKVLKLTKTALPIARTLLYGIQHVRGEILRSTRHCPSSTSPFHHTIYTVWQRQTSIGWAQIFKGRISKLWGKVPAIFYNNNPS